ATDASGVSTPISVKINLSNVNESAPVAFTDTYTVGEGSTLTVAAADGVLKNDTDADSDNLTATMVTSVTNGTLTFNADGSFIYVPTASFSGTDSFTYQATDGTLTSNLATVTINVTGVNDPPVASADAYTAQEDTPLTIAASAGVLANDTDAEGATLTATLVASPTHGTISLSANGGFTYTPAAGYTGDDTFTYQAHDGTFSSSVMTVTITVAPVNDAPLAVNDSYTVVEDSVLTVAVADGVLKNDTDPDSTGLTAQVVNNPLHGTLSLQTDGSFVYTPTADYSGTDMFTYEAMDASSTSNTATVVLTVSPVNDAPVTTADAYAVRQGLTLTVAATEGLLANDSDVEGDALTAVLLQNVTHGTLTFKNDGSFTYVPEATYSGSDSFTYQVTDGAATSAETVVSIAVNTANSFNLLEHPLDGTLVGQLEPFSDTIDAAPLVFEAVDTQVDARLDLVSDDHLTGNPAAPVVLIEYVDFQCPSCAAMAPIVKDLLTAAPDDVLLVRRHLPLTSIHPNALNGAVAAEAAARQGKFDEMAEVLFEKQTEWQDATNPRTFFVTYAGDLGLDTTQFANDMEDADLLARVNRDLNVAQDLGLSATPSLYVNGTHLTTLPTTLAEFQTVVDTELDSLTSPFLVNRLTGQVLVRDGNLLDFATQPTWTFDFKVSDAEGDSETLTATVQLVQSTNVAPVATADAYTLNEDDVLTVGAGSGLLANDSDADGDSLVLRVETNPANGTLIANTNGSFSYSPNSDFAGTDSFTYRVSDGRLDSAETTVTLTVINVNDAPMPVADTYVLDANTTLTTNTNDGILVNDLDVDGDALGVSLIDNVQHGALTLNADGTFIYSPMAGFSGNDGFTYRLSDGDLSTDGGVVTLVVTAVNRAPQAVADAYYLNVNNTLSVDAANGILANDIEPDGDTMLPTVVVQPTHGTLLLAGDGTFQFTPEADYVGADSFSYQLSDGDLDSNVVAVSLTINPLNTFNVDENAHRGTVVGKVTADSTAAAPLLFDLANDTIDDRLQLVVSDHLSGDPAAPVVLIEYLDFQCPSCKAYHSVVKKLEEDYAGQLLVVRRHFPLTSIHPNAFAAGVAAEAASNQGKFDEFGTMLFDNQAEWQAESDPTTFFEQYASTLGLNIEQFRADMTSSDGVIRVQRDLDDAVALGNNATPTFYVNGEKLADLPGSQSEFATVIQDALAAVDAAFMVDRMTGDLLVLDPTQLDFETIQTIAVNVRVSDGDDVVSTVNVTVNLNDLNDQATGATLSFVALVDEALADENLLA
ncbi:MAG: tandem-95 repeat protein, partial [Planctomycetales bacterium]|nr:tandem-95 repeat protein [Planctomycetales bacterium]